ncbi:hypothetical protein ACOME3_005935 [Neoechinorhynchus agilis]
MQSRFNAMFICVQLIIFQLRMILIWLSIVYEIMLLKEQGNHVQFVDIPLAISTMILIISQLILYHSIRYVKLNRFCALLFLSGYIVALLWQLIRCTCSFALENSFLTLKYRSQVVSPVIMSGLIGSAAVLELIDQCSRHYFLWAQQRTSAPLCVI